MLKRLPCAAGGFSLTCAPPSRMARFGKAVPEAQQRPMTTLWRAETLDFALAEIHVWRHGGEVGLKHGLQRQIGLKLSTLHQLAHQLTVLARGEQDLKKVEVEVGAYWCCEIPRLDDAVTCRAQFPYYSLGFGTISDCARASGCCLWGRATSAPCSLSHSKSRALPSNQC